MKNFVVLIVALCLISFSACSQKNPPDNIKKEFSQKFAGAKSVKWVSEEENEWEAEFKLDGKEMSACFDNAGKWLETEAEVSAKELPAAVANTLKNEFPGFKTDEILTIENPEMKGYEFDLKNKKTEMTVIIGADGTVIKKESSEEKKEEADNEKDEKNENESAEAGKEKEMKAPEIIISAFNQKFPGATSVEWGSENANEWEAEFKLDGKEMSACFDNAGKWLETETGITLKDLPSSVLSALNKDFGDFKKDEISILESPEIKGFEVTLKKGESSLEVVFDNSGKTIKKTEEAKEGDEKDEKDEKGEK